MSEPGQDKLNIYQQEAQEIEKAYDHLLDKIKDLFNNTHREDFDKKIIELLNFIIFSLSAEGNSLLLYTSKIFDKDYIFAHSLNVCLISVRMGMRLSFDHDGLRALAFLGLTHIKENIKPPTGLLDNVKKTGQSDAIVALADVYDSITHPPAYRHVMTPYETISSLINTNKFDRYLIRIFLEELTLYPRGSWVELSTKEIGKVINVNKNYLLRPSVRILVDAEGCSLKEPRVIDLSKNMLIYVSRQLSEEEISQRIKK